MQQVRDRIVLNIRVKGDQENAAKLIEELDPVDSVSMGDDVILATLKEGVDDYSEIASHVISAGFKIVMFREEEINLESAFMTLTRGVGKKI